MLPVHQASQWLRSGRTRSSRKCSSLYDLTLSSLFLSLSPSLFLFHYALQDTNLKKAFLAIRRTTAICHAARPYISPAAMSWARSWLRTSTACLGAKVPPRKKPTSRLRARRRSVLSAVVGWNDLIPRPQRDDLTPRRDAGAHTLFLFLLLQRGHCRRSVSI